MKTLIEEYYRAWETKDLSLLKQSIHDDIYGVRTFNELKLYSNDEVYSHFPNSTIVKVDIIEFQQKNDDIDLKLYITHINEKNDENKDRVNVKITLKEGKIYRVYEAKPTKLKRIKCIISYDGSSFYGYQKQLNEISIQETLEVGIKRAFKLEFKEKVHSSGRTDKGVHALNQVVHFDINTPIKVENMRNIINSYLPDTIFVKSLEEIANTHHSRFDVKAKEYLYKINKIDYDPIQRNYEWFVPNIDVEKFNNCLQKLVGIHDYQAFTKTTLKDTTREIFSIKVKETEQHIYTYVRGNGFLRYMVRNIIGAAVVISNGKLDLTMDELLESRNVNLFKDKAPACGLYLNKVIY